MSLVVRHGSPHDVGALAPLAPSFPGEAADVFLRRILEGVLERPDTRALFVAELSGRAVGYGRVGGFTPPDDAPANMVPAGWLLSGTVVDPAHRRRGIGRALLEARLQWLDARGGPAHYWANDDNAASIALHAPYGFEPLLRDFVFVAPRRDDAPRTLYVRPPPG